MGHTSNVGAGPAAPSSWIGVDECDSEPRRAAQRRHGRGQVAGALGVGGAEHRPPAGGVTVVFRDEHRQHPAACH